jgi:hypothetical protein
LEWSFKLKKIIVFTCLIMGLQNAKADFFKTTLDELASPVTTDAKYYLLGGSVLTGLLALDGFDRVEQHIQYETVDDKPLGKYSKYGDLAGQMVPNAIYILANYTLGYFSDDPKLYDRSLHMFKATLYSGLATNILKYTVRERRPDSNHRDSFPSGHTTSAFAFAAVIGTEHEWYWAVPAYTLAAVVAYSRINDNAHRVHDVVAGATIGLSYGLSLHYLYKDEKSEVAKYSISPYGKGLMLGYHTEF